MQRSEKPLCPHWWHTPEEGTPLIGVVLFAPAFNTATAALTLAGSILKAASMPSDQAVVDFFAAISAIKHAYSSATIRYLAGRREGAWSLVQAQILLHAGDRTPVTRTFMSDHIRAGVFQASGPAYAPDALIDTLLAAKFPVEDGEIPFEFRISGDHDLFHLKTYPDPLRNATNTSGLRLTGTWTQSIVNLHELGWELMAAEPVYEDLGELTADFGLGPLQSATTCVEVRTAPVLQFTDKSKVSGDSVTLGIRLASGLDVGEVSLGRKLKTNVGATSRDLKSSVPLNWEKYGDGYTATVSFEVEKGSTVLCSLRYRGVTQSFATFRDQLEMSNPRRTAYEAIDPGLVKLREMLETFKVAERNSPEFEMVIVRLFWLAGFNPIHLGDSKKTQKAGDILAFASDGDLLVIECTTGILKQDKRSQLLRRAEAVRNALRRSKVIDVHVSPLMVTCLPATEIEADSRQAEADGIMIYAYEDVVALFEATMTWPDARSQYEHVRQRVIVAAINQEVDTE